MRRYKQAVAVKAARNIKLARTFHLIAFYAHFGNTATRNLMKVSCVDTISSDHIHDLYIMMKDTRTEIDFSTRRHDEGGILSFRLKRIFGYIFLHLEIKVRRKCGRGLLAYQWQWGNRKALPQARELSTLSDWLACPNLHSPWHQWQQPNSRRIGLSTGISTSTRTPGSHGSTTTACCSDPLSPRNGTWSAATEE